MDRSPSFEGWGALPLEVRAMVIELALKDLVTREHPITSLSISVDASAGLRALGQVNYHFCQDALQPLRKVHDYMERRTVEMAMREDWLGEQGSKTDNVTEQQQWWDRSELASDDRMYLYYTSSELADLEFTMRQRLVRRSHRRIGHGLARWDLPSKRHSCEVPEMPNWTEVAAKLELEDVWSGEEFNPLPAVPP